MKPLFACSLGLVGTLSVAWVEPGWGQRIRFPSPGETTVSQGAATWTAPASPPPAIGIPSPGATLGQGIQPFDPYASVGPPPPLTAPAAPPPTWTAPPGSFPSTMPPPYYPYGGTGPSPFPQQPSSLFPEGLPQTFPGTTGDPPYQRLFQNTGFTWTWLYGSEGNELEMHDVDIRTSAVFHFFAHSGQGLRLSPGFTFHFLDGPQPPIPTNTNLPAQLYDAYLDAQWDPRLTQQFGAELNFRVGVYSDFGKVISDSVRFTGTGLGVLQVTPRVAVKLGATYLDRLDVKILPAGGVVWEPDPQTKFDILFPSPRLAHYWTTLGNADIWWYLGGEYGGGNWTMERLNPPLVGLADRIDINDIRLFGGFQWFGLNERVGFFEVGYVFDREILFHRVPADNLKLDDTFMLRGGFHF